MHQGTLATPATGMLEGISRRTVIEMARSLGLAVETRVLPAGELRGAQEEFISTSGGGVLPATRVDRDPIGDGAPGPITKQLVQTYWDWHNDPAYGLPIDYAA